MGAHRTKHGVGRRLRPVSLKSSSGLSVFLALWGCDHQGLDFDLEGVADGGVALAVKDAGVAAGPAPAGQPGTRPAATSDGTPGQGVGADGSEASSTGGTERGGDAQADMAALESSRPPFDIDPVGHPTEDDQWASWCADGEIRVELCGTEIDEDCDGTVDELADIGRPCVPHGAREGCDDHGFTICEAGTRDLLCVPTGCSALPVEPECGNGFLEAGEQCDYREVDETLGVTCTRDCERQLFTQCVFTGGDSVDDFECEEDTTCSDWVGACMPTLGGRLLRCPQIPVWQGDEPEGDSTDTRSVYPMVETEDGQCWISCSDGAQCPSSLSHCYMGFCVVDF